VFKSPVQLGYAVSFYSQLAHTGRTYVTVDNRVYAQRGLSVIECIKVTDARFIGVAIDENCKPQPLQSQPKEKPSWPTP
jgi:acyl-CoA thioesterase YciA